MSPGWWRRFQAVRAGMARLYEAIVDGDTDLALAIADDLDIELGDLARGAS